MLYVGNKLISENIEQCIEDFKGNRVRHRLLNGDYTVQDIGKVALKLDIVCYVDFEQKKDFDISYINNFLLSIEHEGETLKGYVDEYPKVKEVIDSGDYNKKWYSLSFILYTVGDI